jgi:hypothetical protein
MCEKGWTSGNRELSSEASLSVSGPLIPSLGVRFLYLTNKMSIALNSMHNRTWHSTNSERSKIVLVQAKK